MRVNDSENIRAMLEAHFFVGEIMVELLAGRLKEQCPASAEH